MESNITTILIKKFWKRCETFPLNGLQRCKTLHFGCPLSLTTLPSEVPALFPPPPLTPRKNVPYLKRNQSDFCQDVIICCDIKIVYKLRSLQKRTWLPFSVPITENVDVTCNTNFFIMNAFSNQFKETCII